jgi:hypothetical protein
MFERYTERARRAVFFARYEASQFGSPYIEAEHILLGILREDHRIPRWDELADLVRKRIEESTTIRHSLSASIDLPLANGAKRVLGYAAEEAERLSRKYIGSEHLLLGILRENNCFAATILREAGLDLKKARDWSESVAPDADQHVLAVGYARLNPMLEFVFNGRVIGGATLDYGVVPIFGERVLLKDREGNNESYRVKNVTHVYQHVPYEGEIPQRLITKVIIDLEPE